MGMLDLYALSCGEYEGRARARGPAEFDMSACISIMRFSQKE